LTADAIPPRPGDPPPPVVLGALKLTSGDLNSGVANITLPFDFSISTAALVPGGPLDVKQSTYNFNAGSPVTISTDGRLIIGGDPASPRTALSAVTPSSRGQRGVLNVLPADLVLKDGGLRSGVFGPEGQRSLIIEWDGAIAGRSDNSRVLVRAIISEVQPTIRFVYEIVPPNVGAAPSVQFADGSAQFSQSVFGGDGPAPINFWHGV